MNINPQSVYKYGSWGTGSEHLIFNNTIKLTEPSDFNDPYDCNIPQRYDLMTREEFDKRTLDIVKQTFPDRSEEFYKQQQQFAWQDGPLRKNLKLGTIENIWLSETRQWKEVLGVFCASKSWDNILLWSHYANNHYGFCVKLNSRVLIESIKGTMGPVIYEEELPKIIPTDKRDMSDIMRKVYTKYAGWKYEDEIRFTSMHQANGIIELKSGAIEEIYLGARIISDKKSELIKRIRNISQLKTIPIFEIKPQITSYKLERTLLPTN